MNIKGYLIAAFITVSVPLMAEDAKKDTCAGIDKLAMTIMEHRQRGTSLKLILGTLKGNEFNSIVLDAYDSPRYSVKSNQQKAISEFTNKWHVACLKVSLKL